MLLQLIRNEPVGSAITGKMLVDYTTQENASTYQLTMDTLEHIQYAIPAGFYRIRLTYSPKFQEILPLLDGVIGRSGIRIHAGNTIEHTTGCILVGVKDASWRLQDGVTPTGERLFSSRKTLNLLRDYLLNYQKQHPNEEMYIEIKEPDSYPLYDSPCPVELQMR